MAVKIVSARQVLHVSSLITYIYADPGLGKTSLAYTASRPIVVDFDAGAHRAGKLRRGATIPVSEWADVTDIEASDLVDYDTIIVDTAGRMLDVIKAHLAKNASNRQADGTLKLKAHGTAGEMFRTWLSRIRSYGKDIVLIAHAAEDKKGDNIIFRPDIGGKNQGELYKQADLMGYMTNNETKGGDTVRTLDFVPNTAFYAKNSGGLGCIDVPDLAKDTTFLARQIQQSKDYINSMTEDQIKDLADEDDLKNWIHDCELCQCAQDLNELKLRMDEKHSRIKMMRSALSKAIKELDVTYDSTNEIFVDNDYVGTETTATQVQPDSRAAAIVDAVLDSIVKAKTDGDIKAIEIRIEKLSTSLRPQLLAALENKVKELEGHTQNFVPPATPYPAPTPSGIPDELLDDPIIPRLTLEEFEQKMLDIDSIADLDALILVMEKHDILTERKRLLVAANRKRASLLAEYAA